MTIRSAQQPGTAGTPGINSNAVATSAQTHPPAILNTGRSGSQVGTLPTAPKAAAAEFTFPPVIVARTGSGCTRGTEAQAIAFEESCTDLAKQLADVAGPSNKGVSITIDTASAAQFSGMLTETHRKFRDALSEAQNVVHLAVGSLRQAQSHDHRYLESFLECLEKQPTLEKLELFDTFIDSAEANQIRSLIGSIPTLRDVDLSKCTLSQAAKEVLGLRNARPVAILLG